MNKMILMGVLALSGLVFAPFDTNTLYGRTFIQTGCQYIQAYDLLSDANSYGYYIYAAGCYPFTFGGLLVNLGNTMSNVDDDFYSMLETCSDGGAGTQECASAKAAFYSSAASARGSFRSAMATYYQAAGQSAWSYGYTGGSCGTSRGNILEDVLGEVQGYHRCINGGGFITT